MFETNITIKYGIKKKMLHFQSRLKKIKDKKKYHTPDLGTHQVLQIMI